MIPTEKECYDLMDQYRMLDNVREHSIVVAEIVRAICHGLVHSGVKISVDKAVAGALLHDIAKTQCLQTGGDHAAIGREICLKHHLDEIADIVAEHIWLKSYSLDGVYTEKEIVYYGDKRVLHTSVVNLDERMHDIIDRYGKNDSRLSQLVRMNFNICQGIERKLFKRLNFRPEQLADMIQE
ncbi:MAG: HDIG domain-containing protein [Deltaproteobacteria bacterium]|nr:HDIG domain-containing protein [Deltaproteobacteria bacterium]